MLIGKTALWRSGCNPVGCATCIAFAVPMSAGTATGPCRPTSANRRMICSPASSAASRPPTQTRSLRSNTRFAPSHGKASPNPGMHLEPLARSEAAASAIGNPREHVAGGSWVEAPERSPIAATSAPRALRRIRSRTPRIVVMTASGRPHDTQCRFLHWPHPSSHRVNDATEAQSTDQVNRKRFRTYGSPSLTAASRGVAALTTEVLHE